MTTNELNYDYKQAINKAVELENIAVNIEIVVKEMDNELAELSSTWQSDNSSKYITKVITIKDEFEAQAKKLRKNADAIRQAAKLMQNSERRASDIV